MAKKPAKGNSGKEKPAKEKPTRGNSAKAKEKSNQVDQDDSGKPQQSTRETVESIVVAFILAFLFRAFVAEAFVIPTGSMAPTLMGAHKDIFCEHCGQQYQASGSVEYDPNTGALQYTGTGYPKTVASLCSNCRGLNAYDFGNNANHETFSGDRILVSKFDYILSSPKRWDVFVFKYPQKARMNYIKRLVGLPGESLRLWHGDVFVATPNGWRIAQKPPHKIQAMKQLVHNTDHQPKALISQGWPSSWQPLQSQSAKSGWSVEHTPEQWTATLSNTAETSWLRYYHKFADVGTWRQVQLGEKIEPADPYASQLITDFVAYNSYYAMNDARQLFDLKQTTLDRFLPPPFRRGPYFIPDESKTGGERAFEATITDPTIGYRAEYVGEGELHWVGDLSGEFEVEVGSDTGTLHLDLVEFGIHFRCSIDIATGKASLFAVDGEQRPVVFENALKGETNVQGKGKYRLELANFDDQIVLWVNGSVVEFNGTTSYSVDPIRSEQERRPHWSENDPLDAAPVGIGGSNLELVVRSARVHRDIYYIADTSYGAGFSDFHAARVRASASTVPDPSARLKLSNSLDVIAAVYEHPEWWAETDLFSMRAKEYFELADGDDPATDEIETRQYFPMGDNSAASSDARAWFGRKFVEERYLLGKALLVFFPHPWNTPVPFTPNIQRMGLIR